MPRRPLPRTVTPIELPSSPRILVIRRDNIGDLLCTTPLITALRDRYPAAWIGALVNSYNAPVLAGNPCLDAVLAYDKGKHLSSLRAKLAAHWRRFDLIRDLRARRLDLAILAAPGYQASAHRFAVLAAPRMILGYSAANVRLLPERYPPEGVHEVVATYALLAALGVENPPPPMTVVPDAAEAVAVRSAIPAGTGPVVGLHISARKESQRWPIERFAALARRLHADYRARFLLFWAPGSSDDPRHPGDDGRAAALAAQLTGLPFAALPTQRLAQLIAGLSLCDRVVCSDGGAMHIAAALGKPIVCFFGKSDASRWHPWGTPHVVVQPQSQQIADVTVAEAVTAFAQLEPLLGARMAERRAEV